MLESRYLAGLRVPLNFLWAPYHPGNGLNENRTVEQKDIIDLLCFKVVEQLPVHI